MNAVLYCFLGYDIFVQWRIESLVALLGRYERMLKINTRTIARMSEEDVTTELEMTQLERKLDLYRKHGERLHKAVLEMTRLKLDLLRVRDVAARAEEIAEITELVRDMEERYRDTDAVEMQSNINALAAVDNNLSVAQDTEPDKELVSRYLLRRMPDAPITKVVSRNSPPPPAEGVYAYERYATSDEVEAMLESPIPK